MKVGILGTGNMGSGFARHFSTAGHDVFVGSRDSQHGKEVGSVFRVGGGSYQEVATHVSAA